MSITPEELIQPKDLAGGRLDVPVRFKIIRNRCRVGSSDNRGSEHHKSCMAGRILPAPSATLRKCPHKRRFRSQIFQEGSWPLRAGLYSACRLTIKLCRCRTARCASIPRDRYTHAYNSRLQPAESFTELLRRMTFDKHQNGLHGPFVLSHLFVSVVNRQWISQTGNDWCEQLSVARESVHCILD